MGALSVLRIVGSALSAQRLRMDVTASNIANAETTATPEGGPYRRSNVMFVPVSVEASLGAKASKTSPDRAVVGGVAVSAIVQDTSPPRLVLDPTHPDADPSGYVAFPNVDLVTETADMLAASRAYEANITVVNVAKSMAQRALDIGRS